MTVFESTVAGIPCQIEVTHFYGGAPAKLSGPPERCEPEEPAEADFVVLDRRGYPAAWLERKLTREDRRRIEQECIDQVTAEGEEC